MSAGMPELLTVRQAAERLTLSAASVYEMVKSGRLPAVRLGPNGGAIRIRLDDLDACIASQAAPTPQPSPAQVPRRVQLRHIRL